MERTKEWNIKAAVSGRTIGWSYDDAKDAKRAWNHMSRKRTTIDTGDAVDGATLRLPNGDIYYLGESVRW